MAASKFWKDNSGGKTNVTKPILLFIKFFVNFFCKFFCDNYFFLKYLKIKKA